MRTLARIAAAFAVAATLATTACGADSSTAPRNDLAGKYTLRTIDGAPLPVVMFDTPDGQISITGGDLTLSSEGIFVQTTVLGRAGGPLPPSTISLVCSGSWTHSGSRLTLAFDPTQPCGPAGSVDAAYASGTITFSDVQGTMVYKR